MKKHKLAKKALDHPDLFAPAELAYFELWLRARKEEKQSRKQKPDDDPDEVYKP